MIDRNAVRTVCAYATSPTQFWRRQDVHATLRCVALGDIFVTSTENHNFTQPSSQALPNPLWANSDA